ncbi:taste receptor type 2 member 39-like [Engystomops pustulosus]|uniref:taste receptor type 2 member 39-like n=1 Tax=Engystomops pustulosus TaxID=76066 RepID=UPI003AFB55C8
MDEVLLRSLYYTECIAGVIVNLIIVAANIIKWRRMKSLDGEKILISLATSRCLFLLSAFLLDISLMLDSWNIGNIQVLYKIISLFLTFLHFTNFWFATVLCVFYCVKITSYSWKFFILLKTKISTLVPRFLLASLLISASFSLPLGWSHDGIQEKNLTNHSMDNMTVYRNMKYEGSQTQSVLIFTGSGPPFLVFFAAITLLLHSLWMHTRRMRSSGSGFRRPNLESHISAVKSMSLFLVLQTMYFVLPHPPLILHHLYEQWTKKDMCLSVTRSSMLS